MGDAKQYDNENKGALYRNDKQGVENRPDYTGSLNVDGREYWLSAWIRESKAGNKFMSLAVKPKEARSAAPTKPADPDEDLPF